MVLAFSIIGIILSVILLYFNARKYRSSIYLGLFFLGVSLYSLYHFALISSKSVTLVSLFLLTIPIFSSFFYLIGPMLYWYVRSVLTDKHYLKKNDIWHFLPMIIYLISAIPNFFTPWSLKMEAARAIVENVGAMQQFKPTLLSEIFSYPIMFLSRPVFILVYNLWAIIIFIRFLMYSSTSSVLSRQNFMTKWLSFLLGSLLILIVSHILLVIDLTLAGSQVFFTLTSLQIGAAAGLTVLLISPFFFPGILYGLPRLPERKVIFMSETGNIKPMPAVDRKTETHFESDYLMIIQNKAEMCMKELQPYLQADCNLAYFSKLTKIPVHHLAYYFREEKKQTFNDYRNEWRIKHAKNLIKEGKNAELTLEAIGLLSGFSSRNTFFTAFKKAEGISPGSYAAKFAA
jgi:AraC-like DNA-binding protein